MEWRALVRIAAVYAATATAGLAIMMPVSYGWFSSEPQKVDLMVRSVPLAMESGAITAVIAAAAVVSVGSARAAWYAAALALTGILVNHIGLPWIQIESLTTLNFVDALWAGVVLGCLAPLVWTPSLAGGAYLFGCVSSAVFGDLAQPPPDAGGPRSMERLFGGAPPVWLILVALMLLVTHLVARDRREAIPGDGPDFSLAPIVSGVVAVFVLARTSRWLAESGDRWPVVVTAVALVLLGAFVAALILPGRDGTLLLLLVGFSAAASAVVTVPRPGWADALVDVTVAAGLLVAWLWPRPYLAVAGSMVLAAMAALLAVTGVSTVYWAVLGVAAIGLIGGGSVGSALPRRATSAVVGLAVLFVPSAGIALRGRPFGRIGYSPHWYRLAQVPHEPVPAYTALVITAGCAAGIYLLRRWRPVEVRVAERAAIEPRV
ncbi:hypothetical protein [Nocardia tengchongensis]|uniref:hypothetical protein n=1 Tax=Nocardia tengchongensis TaxID=2055889 RepID=UPI003622EE3C